AHPLFLHSSLHHRDLHSFPTRRSSDLQSDILRNVHIAPSTLKVAAMFAVMTRLEEPKRANVDIVKKMKLYDGEDVEGYKSKDVRSEEHTSELQSPYDLVCRLLLEKKKK